MRNERTEEELENRKCDEWVQNVRKELDQVDKGGVAEYIVL